MTSYAYNALNKPLTQTVTYKDGTTLTTKYTYDANGDELSTTDSEGNTTSWTYDSAGRQITTTDPEGVTKTNTYDANGNLVQTTDGAGDTTTMSYDSAGNATSVVLGPGNAFVAQYNPQGTLSAFDGNGALPQARTYNNDGAPTTSSTLWTDPSNPSNQVTLTSSVAYNADGKTTGTTDPNGNTTQTVYNADGQVASGTDVLGNTTSMKYDPGGTWWRPLTRAGSSS